MYATLADMLARYDEADLVQLTDQAGTGTIDAVRVDTALKSASTRIDGYVATKYRTAGVAVHPLLVDLACTLARYQLFRDAPPESVVADRKDAIATLEKIASGAVKLDDGASEPPIRDGAIVVSRPDRIFGRDSMSGY